MELGSADLERLDQALTGQGLIRAVQWLVEVHGWSVSEAHAFLIHRAGAIGHTLDPPEPDVARLRDRITRSGREILAIEAIWDGDSRGWFVLLLAITQPGVDKRAELQLGLFREAEGDMRIFNGQVPPWPEAQRAASVGQALAAELHVPFNFASPDGPPRFQSTQ